MRDPNRIDNVLAAIGNVWKQYPDLRLGQLLSNVYHDPALYYVEDDKLVEEVQNYYDELAKGVDLLRQMKANDEEYDIGSLLQHMRSATEEELEFLNEYIDSIAIPTGYTIWDFYKD